MLARDALSQSLDVEIRKIPLIDPHSHINPNSPTARSLDDILGYHYYTELAHSAGMDKKVLAPDYPPRERVRAIVSQMEHFDNTAQYHWFLEICRTFLGFEAERIAASDVDPLYDKALAVMAAGDWEEQVLARSGIEKVFLTNDFDDPLQGFDATRYVPCLRTDDLVFHLGKPEVRARLAKATGIEAGDSRSLKRAVARLFDHFVKHGAKACAISLPPSFAPVPASDAELDRALLAGDASDAASHAVFRLLVEQCHEHQLPFDLMIGVNRRVYEQGVFQGQDLFDQRTSLIQYARVFNDFPTVKFCLSVLTSVQNQELVSYAWIFPNVITCGHWWYSNIPAYIKPDLRARLQAVPKTKQIAYYSDMYKLEFGLPKFDMYRQILAEVLADDFVRPKLCSEAQAIALARQILRTNVEAVFKA